jgi:hypothetical protein
MQIDYSRKIKKKSFKGRRDYLPWKEKKKKKKTE